MRNSALKTFMTLALAALVIVTPLGLGETVAQSASPTFVQKCGQYLKRKWRRMRIARRLFWYDVVGHERRAIPAQGWERFVAAPRRDGQRFNWFAALIDPFFDGSVETISYVRWRVFKQEPLSMRYSAFSSWPAGLVAWGMVLGWAGEKAELWGGEGLVAASRADLYGSEYLGDWVMSSVLPAKAADDMINGYQKSFAHDLLPVRDRVREMVALGLWTLAQAETVHQALDRIKQAHSPAELAHDKTLRAALEADAGFTNFRASLPDDHRFTADLLLDPRFVYKGRDDAAWLADLFISARQSKLDPDARRGVASLARLYAMEGKNLSLATMTLLVGDTLKDPSTLAGKIAKAKALGIDKDFVYRADLPIFTTDEIFTDVKDKGEHALHDELDRWELIFNDPRFHSYRDALLAGKVSEFTALFGAEMQIRALGQVYADSRTGPAFKSAQACKLIYGGAEIPPNPLFAKLRTLDQRLHWPPEKQKLIAGLRFELADLYFSTFMTVATATTIEEVDGYYAQAQAMEIQLVHDVGEGLAGVPAVPADCAGAR